MIRVRESAAPSGTSRANALSKRLGGSAAMLNSTTVEERATDMDPLSHSTLNEGHILWLRRMVMTLIIVMIVGVVTITGLLIRKLNQTEAPALPDLAAVLTEGVIAYSVTPDWIITTTRDGTVMVYAKSDLSEIATFAIPAP